MAWKKMEGMNRKKNFQAFFKRVLQRPSFNDYTWLGVDDLLEVYASRRSRWAIDHCRSAHF